MDQPMTRLFLGLFVSLGILGGVGRAESRAVMSLDGQWDLATSPATGREIRIL